MRRLVSLVALAATIAAVTASSTLGALVNGFLPADGFIVTSVLDNTVRASSSGVTPNDIAALQRYVGKLAAIRRPSATQLASLATYRARLADYEARYAAGIDLWATKATNVKTTYSRVPPSPTYEAGWHVHNGPVIVTVTVGTLTLVDSNCVLIDVRAGHSYVESPGQVLDAKALPAKNAGIDNVEWFTTRLYPAGAIDPVPFAPSCTS